MSIVYTYHGNLYVNLTNRCTAACTFCIKNKWQRKFRGHDLKLAKEPTVAQVIKAIKDPKRIPEIVFCGYGEPFMRLEELKEIARWVKSKGGFVRVNTSGHANLFYGRNVVPELKGLIDAISISLNASNARQYEALHRPLHGKKAFRAVLDFAKECARLLPDVTLTCIELPEVDVKKCAAIAKRLKVKFRLRPYLDEYEKS